MTPSRLPVRLAAGALIAALAAAAQASTKLPTGAKPATPASVSTPKLDVKTWTLANGLKVLFLADHKAPIATVQVFYHVGSKDEHLGIRALAYLKHPYNWTAIGTIEDLETVTPADAQRFYDSYYQPNNATLLVVGDVDEATVRKLADEAFGSIPRGPAPPRTPVVEPPQTAARTATLPLEVQIPVVVGGYHIPGAADADVPALEVLATILSGGESSRLHQRLVRHDHLAIAAGGLTEPLEDPGLFIVYAAYLPDRDPAKVAAALAEEIARVRDKPVTPEELDRAKNQLAAGFVFGLQTVDGVAQALGHAEYVEGDWHRFTEGATRYLAVTAADVQRVAQKYLVDTNFTRVTLIPTAGAPATPPTPPTGGAK